MIGKTVDATLKTRCPGLVSVVIPCYNNQATIERAIKSALCQSYSHIEVIVIDDGSSDNSKKIIRSFGDQITWIEGRNRGACYARNRGVGMSCGEYLQFLDADDELLEGKIERQVHLVSNVSTDVGFVVGGFERVHEKKLAQVVAPSDEDFWVALIKGGGRFGNTCANLWRADAIVNSGGWNIAWPASQETELMFRLLRSGWRPIIDRSVLTRIHTQDDSISNSSRHLVCRPEAWECWVRIRTQIAQYLESIGQMNPDRQDAFQMRIIELGRLYSRQDLSVATKTVEEILKHHRLAIMRPHLLYRLLFNLFGFALAENFRAIYGEVRNWMRRCAEKWRVRLMYA